jgi:uncharacterized SAM-binding protein YcdF (DUF218 family)
VRTWVTRLTSLVFGSAFAFLTGLVLFAASINHYAPTDTTTQASAVDAIVVLTGGEARIQEGMRLFRTAQARRLLISGVNPKTTRDDIRRSSGLPQTLFECCVDIGYSAQDTAGNAEETRNWAQIWGFDHLIIVTSNYHMPRGLTELGRTLPSVDLVPHAVVSRHYQAEHWWLHLATIRLVVSEYIKFLPSVARAAATRVGLVQDPAPTDTPWISAPRGNTTPLQAASVPASKSAASRVAGHLQR